MRLQVGTYSPEPLSGPHFSYIARSHLSSSCVSLGFVLRVKQKSFVRTGALHLVFSMRFSRFLRISSVCSFAKASWNLNESRFSPVLASSCSPKWRLGSIFRTSLDTSVCLRKQTTLRHYFE